MASVRKPASTHHEITLESSSAASNSEHSKRQYHMHTHTHAHCQMSEGAVCAAVSGVPV